MTKYPIEKGPFKPTWESLRAFECPKWFRDAKLGIWAHWGPQCVPMYGDWYARRMYEEGGDQYLHHWRVYGHPSKHGYKDIVKLWKAEKFDPEGLMDLYAKAGAKYFTAQAVHHDNFDNWNSKHHKWNAVKVGPRKNIVRLFEKAARKRGLYFGVTEHLGATFKWFGVSKKSDSGGPYAGVPYEGNDPKYRDLYLPNKGEVLDGWYTDNPWWHKRWFDRMKDVIDQHHPDLFYSDGGVPFYRPENDVNCPEPGLSLIAHLYNVSAKRNGGSNQAVYNQKDVNQKVYTVGVLDIERGMASKIAKHPWQTDTCVGGWFYNVRCVYKTWDHIIGMLVNIVSKNGNLLLNFTQLPDGSLDDECLYILDRMAGWIAINGEGIYETRPWKVAEEGGDKQVGEVSGEGAVEWTSRDFRFTQKGKTVYAFQMKWPDNGRTLIKSLGTAKGSKTRAVDVSLLGVKGKLKFKQTARGLDIQLPGKQPCEIAHCFKVELA